MKVKIDIKQDYRDTKIYNSETGDEIKNIYRIECIQDVSGESVFKIFMRNHDVTIEGEAEIFKDKFVDGDH